MKSDISKRRRTWIILGSVAAVAMVAGLGAWRYHHQPQFCGWCHIMDPYVEPWVSSAALAEPHAAADVSCLECHQATIAQQAHELVTFVRGEYENPLAEREFDQQWCLQCHEHGSYDELVVLTQYLEPNPHESTHGALDCNACHNVHRESLDYCAPCHEPVVSDQGWLTATRVPEWWTPEWDCAYCHPSDAASTQDTSLLAGVHAQQGLACLDCHDAAELQPLHDQATTAMPVFRTSWYPNQYCFDCHLDSPHPDYEAIIALTAEYTVEGEQTNPHDPHPDSETLQGRPYECYRCHTMHSESQGLGYCNECHHDRTW